MMEFVVVDVETANQDPSSICQIGVAAFRNGILAESWGVLVNPEDSFLPFNTRLHGIGAKDVSNSPTWPDLRSNIRALIEQRTVASHTLFDRAALSGANRRYGLGPIPVAAWLDTCRIARSIWPHLSDHRLTGLARTFDIAYRAHNATEDARCAGELLILAARTAECELENFPGPSSLLERSGRRRLSVAARTI